jgi:hypothetical protein
MKLEELIEGDPVKDEWHVRVLGHPRSRLTDLNATDGSGS